MLGRLKKYFFSGLAVFLPLALAVYVCVWLLNFVERLLGKYLKPFLLENYDFYFWGLGILVLLLIILFSGFLITQYFGRRMHRMAEYWVLQVPLLGSLYPAFKEIATFLFREQKHQIQKVVMVQWPSKGLYTIAFLTNKTAARISAHASRPLCNVMIPSVPNPLTGFMVMFPEDEITVLPISIEEAVKIIASGGVVNGEAAPDPEADDVPTA